jgi:hypothetical protein
MSLNETLLEAPKIFLGKLCERMPLNITFYEKDSFCMIKRESCGYHKLEGEAHLCNKQTYTFLLQPID